MSKKILCKICEYQDIKPEKFIPVRCPGCKNRTLFMSISKGKGVCATCGKTYKEIELLNSAEQDYIDDHKSIDNLMRHNKGVGY